MEKEDKATLKGKRVSVGKSVVVTSRYALLEIEECKGGNGCTTVIQYGLPVSLS